MKHVLFGVMPPTDPRQGTPSEYGAPPERKGVDPAPTWQEPEIPQVGSMNLAEMNRHRVEEVDPEFLTRFPSARLAQIYEFGSEAEAEAAKSFLLSYAFLAGDRARVQVMPWNGRQRVLAIPQ